MTCFEHYFNHEEFWSTKSIQAEIEPKYASPKNTNESQTSTPCISPKSSEREKRKIKGKHVDGRETEQNVIVQDCNNDDSEIKANEFEASAEASLVEEKVDV